MHSICPVISVDLLNSFLPEVWYSPVLGIEETTQKGESDMTTQPDIIWNEQCLGIRIGEQVCTYLKKHNAEYQRLQRKILQLTEKYPVMEKSIRQAIREELAGVSISGSGESVSKKEEIPSQMLDFLSGLEDAF